MAGILSEPAFSQKPQSKDFKPQESLILSPRVRMS